MASNKKRTSNRVERFLTQVAEKGGCGADSHGCEVKGEPVAYQCAICGHVQDEDNRCEAKGCESFAMIEVYELR